MENFKKIFILIFTVFLSINLSFGQHSHKNPYQNPDYGPDSVSRRACLENLSTMSEYVKIKVYEYAYLPWIACYQNCPAASKNIYIYGERILDYKIEKSEDEQTKQAYIDTLMMLFDHRIKYFGQEGKVLGKKGISLLQYRRDSVREAYGYLKRSFELEKSDVDEAVAATLVTCSSVLFQSGKIGADEVIANYVAVSDILNKMPQSEKTKIAIASVEKTFAESGAADCNALISIFTPKYESDSNNLETLKKITELLKQSKCEKSDLFGRAAESLFRLEPSANAGANLGMVFSAREEYPKAMEYFLKAIDLEKDPETKAKFYLQAALVSYQIKNYPDVKKYGYEAINLKPDMGDAYILIGNAYAAASQSCGTSKFEKAAVYLAAVDKLIKAKSVDPTVTERANSLIAEYSRQFPNNEDAFFEGYTDGQTYTVKCWINEQTTIRTNKK